MNRTWRLVLAWSVLGLGLGGCASRPAAQGVELRVGAGETINIPPKQLVEQVRKAVSAPPLSLTVEQAQDGAVLTAYKEGYSGDWHVARRWQERTRFLVRVVPDWDEPTQKSRLEVTEQTQVRTNPKASWSDQEAPRRPERAEEVRQAIRRQIEAGK